MKGKYDNKQITLCHKPSSAKIVSLNWGLSPIMKKTNDIKLRIKNIRDVTAKYVSSVLNSITPKLVAQTEAQ